MDATKSFKELLEQIEDSKLNYVISKTPFSANISVKRSFIRYHGDGSSEREMRVKEETQTYLQKNENEELKLENEKLQVLLKQQTAKVNTLEGKLKESRGELATVKKELNSSNSKSKVLAEELRGIKQHSSELCETIRELENEVKDKANTVRVKNNACMKFKKEKEELEYRLSEVLEESKFKCKFCDFNVECGVKLSKHIRRTHCKDQASQISSSDLSKETSEPSRLECEYPCFYCGYIIKTKEHLEKHLADCQEVCALNISNSESKKKPDLKEAFETYLLHYQKVTARKFQCDICDEIFNSESLLGMHSVFCKSI